MTDRCMTVDETPLPLGEIVTGRGFVTGKSGSGKSNTIGVLVERLLDRGIPVCLVDTEGEYLGLTEEYPILHAGAQRGCDVTVTATDATTIADTVVERHIPVILDISEVMDDEERRELVAGVARRLYQRQKTLQHPLLLIVEECHEFLPQYGNDDEHVKDLLIKVAKRGRKRGLGLVRISQRPADVDKAFITQTDWQLWHRLTWPNDLDVAADLLSRDAASIVDELAVGESLFWSDWTDACQRIQWPRKRTTDYGNAPAIDRALGSTPAQIETDVIESFAVDHGMDVTLPDPARECVEHLLSVCGTLDHEERYMLDYVRSHGPIDPKPAYTMAGGEGGKNVVYESLRTLRGERFLARTGHGTYSYVLPDRVRSHLRFHPDVEQRHLTAIVARLESDFAGLADSPDESTPEPGDTLGTYRITEKDSDNSCVQLGKPVTEYLGVEGGETVAVTPETVSDGSRLLVTPGDETDSELTYSVRERPSEGYAVFAVGTPGIAALTAAPGERVTVTAASEQTVHVVPEGAR